jgi:oligopeptidase A
LRSRHPPEDQAPVWNAACVLPHRTRRRRKAPTLVGQFYLDPTARNGKRGGAWMDDVRARWLRPDTHQVQTPVAHLVCNFADGMEVDGSTPPPC